MSLLSKFVTLFGLLHNFLLWGPCVLLQCTYFLFCYNLLLLLFFFPNTASKARRPYQFSGKITVKAKEKSYSKLEIPYQAEVLEG